MSFLSATEPARPDKNRNSAFLQPPLNQFLIPRPSLPYEEPIDRDFDEKTGPILSGVGQYMDIFKREARKAPSSLSESPAEKKLKRLEERRQRVEAALKAGLEKWRPKESPEIQSDPFKTIFVGRLNYETTERHLQRETERNGGIKSTRIVKDGDGKSRGYAFIEFEREKDVKRAFQEADGCKIDQRRVVVDVERGRTVKTWRPRRLGGGLGGTRIGAKEENITISGRDPRLNEPSSSKMVIVDHRDRYKRVPRLQARSRSRSRSRSVSSRRRRRYEDESKRDRRYYDHRYEQYERSRERDADRRHERYRDHDDPRYSMLRTAGVDGHPLPLSSNGKVDYFSGSRRSSYDRSSYDYR